MALMFPTVMLVLNVSSVGGLWFGAQRIDAGEMQVGSLTAFLSYLVQILDVDHDGDVHARAGPARRGERRAHHRGARDRVVRGVPPSDARLRRSSSGARSSCAAPRSATPAPTSRSSATSRSPPSAGQTTAIIGSTGSGKTTLLSLIPRLFDATGGRCSSTASTCASSTPRCCTRASASSRRRPTCSPAPSRATSRYGKRDATEEELWEALRIAQADDFVRALPDGPRRRRCAQGGTNFSGGQRQRLAIARAVVRRPEIYLFDDSFSALDLATDARLRAALRADHPRVDGDRRRPAGLEHRRRRPDRRARRRRSSSASGTPRRAARRPARRTPRSCESQRPAEEVAA